MTGPYAPPLVVQPSPAASAAGTVPVVRPRTPAPVVAPVATGPAPPASGPPAVQRDTGGTTTNSGRTNPGQSNPGRTDPAPIGAGKTAAAGRPEGARDAVPHGGDLDLDDLARRLLDPVARLLRTELRRGRERAGRPFDGRR